MRLGSVAGLTAAQVATPASGGRPAHLSDEDEIAHDVARAVATGHILPASTYRRAVEAFGTRGVEEFELFRCAGTGGKYGR